jgi:hypothetical protein
VPVRLRAPLVLSLPALVLLAACGGGGSGDPCTPPDADGVLGNVATFVRSVDDAQFLPAGSALIKVQNLTKMTLTLKNVGTTPHGFAVDCLPTPNDYGCATKSCFPADARIPSIEPGASATITFTVPRVEGLYTYRSPVPGDAQTSQIDVN